MVHKKFFIFPFMHSTLIVLLCMPNITTSISRQSAKKQPIISAIDINSANDSISPVGTQTDQTITPHFGTKHFIIGQAPTERNEQIQRTSKRKKKTSAHFSPHGNVRSQLLKLIAQEQKQIQIAVFVFTDKQIADALIAAHQRGVMIEIVIDPAAIKDRHNKIGQLYDAGIQITIYNLQKAQKMSGPSTMHHKFAIFYNNAENRSCLWAGSCNFTKAAFDSNQEYAFIIYDPLLIEQFKKEFEQLKTQTYEHTKQLDMRTHNMKQQKNII